MRMRGTQLVTDTQAEYSINTQKYKTLTHSSLSSHTHPVQYGWLNFLFWFEPRCCIGKNAKSYF